MILSTAIAAPLFTVGTLTSFGGVCLNAIAFLAVEGASELKQMERHSNYATALKVARWFLACGAIALAALGTLATIVGSPALVLGAGLFHPALFLVALPTIIEARVTVSIGYNAMTQVWKWVFEEV